MNRDDLKGETLKEWREAQRLSQEELGQLLGTSREWIGKLERGEREISAEIFLRFAKLVREPRFSPTSDVSDSGSVHGTPRNLPTHVASEDPTAYTVRKEIRSLLDQTLAAAGDDLGRLGWIREQLLRHVTVPEHWSIHERVIRNVLEQERKEKEARAQSARAQGKAS